MNATEKLCNERNELATKLRACKREKREMFAKLSPSCTGRYPISGTCKWILDMTACTQRNCPLLNPGGERKG